MCIVTPIAIKIKSRRKAQCSATKTAQHKRLIHNIDIEIIFAFLGIDLFSIKSRIYGPNTGWFISQPYNLGELFRNKADDSKRNGVVGSTGRKIPMIPRESDKSPNTISKYFISNIL